MARVALVWELGGELGHVTRLSAIARELKRRGHAPVLLLRDVTRARAVLGDLAVPYLAAPLWLERIRGLPPELNFAETLFRTGFLNPPGLASIVGAWRELYAQVGADCIVFDHAPCALLAARGLGVPQLQFGNSFAVLPPQAPFPAYRFWQDEKGMATRMEETESRALRAANEVLDAFAAPRLDALHHLYSDVPAVIGEWRDFDVYGARDDAEYAGPVAADAMGSEPQWPLGDGPRVFAYLKSGYEHVEAVLAQLGKLPARVLAYVPGLSPAAARSAARANLSVSSTPLRLDTLLGQCDYAVTHAGTGTAGQLAAAGVPCLLLPMQIEQAMYSHRVARAGCALNVAIGAKPPVVAKQLRALLGHPGLPATTREWAAREPRPPMPARVARVCDRIETLTA